jgi:hypothetical protein
VVVTVSQGTDATGIDSDVDVELISETTDLALNMELSTSTREAIDARTAELIGHMNLLLVEDLGADKDPDVRELFRQGYRMLDLKQRPSNSMPSFTAFFFMRDIANLTRRLLWVYAEEDGVSVS